MSSKLISLIYFYAVSFGALILLVLGVFSGINFLVNITQFDQYPLRFRSEEECVGNPYRFGKYPVAIDTPSPASPSSEEIEEAKRICLNNIARDRKQQQVNDLRIALTLIFVGGLLFGIHFPVALKKSAESKL